MAFVIACFGFRFTKTALRYKCVLHSLAKYITEQIVSSSCLSFAVQLNLAVSRNPVANLIPCAGIIPTVLAMSLRLVPIWAASVGYRRDVALLVAFPVGGGEGGEK